MTSPKARRTTFWAWCAVIVATAVIGVFAFCSTHGIWSRDEWFVYQMMEAECHPAWTDYHFGQVRAGDDVEQVIAKTNPSVVTRDDDNVVLEYYQNYQGGELYWTGLTAEAENGKMVCAYAHSCEWTRQFFDTQEREEDYFAHDYRRLPQGGAISNIYGY